MMAYIFIDENQSCQFDFSAAIWATNELNTIYHNAKVQLSDVDFIVETETEILFIEYKNAKKFVRERMAGKLPFSLQRQEHFQQNWIDAVVVLNIEEWNDLYSQFPATILAITGDVD